MQLLWSQLTMKWTVEPQIRVLFVKWSPCHHHGTMRTDKRFIGVTLTWQKLNLAQPLLLTLSTWRSDKLRCTKMSFCMPPLYWSVCACGSTVCLTDSHLTSLTSASLCKPYKTAAVWMSSRLFLLDSKHCRAENKKKEVSCFWEASGVRSRSWLKNISFTFFFKSSREQLNPFDPASYLQPWWPFTFFSIPPLFCNFQD